MAGLGLPVHCEISDDGDCRDMVRAVFGLQGGDGILVAGQRGYDELRFCSLKAWFWRVGVYERAQKNGHPEGWPFAK